ncbi:MAG: hypothetical protein LVS60_05500 [Nodosilinea sp. LVE1205-7]|jgi:hypothetical protein
MKHGRKPVSRSTLQKFGAELDQRLREQAAQERRERLNQFRDWLRVNFSLNFFNVFILIQLGLSFLIIKSWLILLPVYTAQLEISIPAVVAIVAILFSYAANFWSLKPLKPRWSRFKTQGQPKFQNIKMELTMQAAEIRKQLDSWLWLLSRDRTQAPPPDQLTQLRQAWAELRPLLPKAYRPIIDDRLAMVDSYAYRQTNRRTG